MLSIEQLKRLPTHRLLAYKREYYPHCHYFDSYNDGDINFEYEEHRKMFYAIREILNTRGHVPRKSEKKKKKV